MKKVLVFAGLLLIAGIVLPAHAIVAPAHVEECSNADLRGLYSFVASGTLGVSPFATAGQTLYDGNGGLTGLIQISMNGNVSSVIPWSGTYNVNSDCTIKKTGVVPGFPDLHFFVTAADNFKELRFIATNPGTTISGTARKQH